MGDWFCRINACSVLLGVLYREIKGVFGESINQLHIWTILQYLTTPTEPDRELHARRIRNYEEKAGKTRKTPLVISRFLFHFCAEF